MSLNKIIILVIFVLLALGFWQAYSQKGNPETDNRQFRNFIITHDDQNILFDYHEHDKHAIYLSKMDGTEVRKIKEGDGRTIKMDLSPDEKKLLMILRRKGDKLFLVDLQNLSETLINEAGDEVESAIFSSDGSKIYFTSVAESKENFLSNATIISVDIFSIDINGTNKKRLNRLPGAVKLGGFDDHNLYLYRTGYDRFTVMKVSLMNPDNVTVLHDSFMDKAYTVYCEEFKPDFSGLIYVKNGENNKSTVYEQKFNHNSSNRPIQNISNRLIDQEFDWLGCFKFLHLENKMIFQGDSPDFMEMNRDGSNIKESPLSKLRSRLQKI